MTTEHQLHAMKGAVLSVMPRVKCVCPFPLLPCFPFLAIIKYMIYDLWRRKVQFYSWSKGCGTSIYIPYNNPLLSQLSAEIENPGGSRRCIGWKGCQAPVSRKRSKSTDIHKKGLCPIALTLPTIPLNTKCTVIKKLVCPRRAPAWQSVLPWKDWVDSTVTWAARHHLSSKPLQTDSEGFSHTMLTGAAAHLIHILNLGRRLCGQTWGCYQYNHWRGSPDTLSVKSSVWFLRHSWPQNHFLFIQRIFIVHCALGIG